MAGLQQVFQQISARWKQVLGFFQPPTPQQPRLQQAPPRSIVLLECNGACGERYGADRLIRTPCNHHYCRPCLHQLFRLALTDTSAYPPRCCRQTIPFDRIMHHLSSDLVKDFAAKKPELDDPSPTYCHVPTCSAYIGDDNKQANIATCPSCRTRTCILCKAAQHAGDCRNDESMQATRQLARNQGWQQCPICRRIVQLTIGCNHMTQAFSFHYAVLC